jgi:hypothetical protein
MRSKVTKLIPLLSFSLALLLSSCSGQKVDKNTPVISKGDYNFIMYDSNNVKIAEGIFDIEKYEGEVISGKYNFTKVITEFEGYGNMRGGNFTGNINEKEKMLLVDTNPGQADRNVFFNLNIRKSPIEGTWYYTGFRQAAKYSRIKLTKK